MGFVNNKQLIQKEFPEDTQRAQFIYYEKYIFNFYKYINVLLFFV